MDEVIEYDSFLIIEKPQKTYKGIYKDGKPYEGYFSKGNNEFPRVDYYENGEAKFQYSLDIYQMALGEDPSGVNVSGGFKEGELDEEDYETYMKDLYKPKLNIKSIYKEGKIIYGYEYEEITSGILSKKIENQKITELQVDVFAMHYYQRNSITLVSDTISIVSPTLAMAGEHLEVQLYKESNYWVTTYKINEVNIGSKYFIKGETENLPANSIIFLYDQNDITYGYGTSGFQEYSDKLDLIDVTKIYFEKPEIFTSQNIQVFFNDFIEEVINEIQQADESRLSEPEIYRGYLITKNNGDIEKGIRFFEKENNSYYMEYKEGSEIKNKKIDLIAFQVIFKEYMNAIRSN